MTPEQQLNEMVQLMTCQKNFLKHIDDKLRILRDAELKKDQSQELIIAQQKVIAANSIYITPPVPNAGYNRCRIEVAAEFATGATGGVGISIVYGNSPIGQVSDMVSSNGSSIYRSEPINVKHFSGFSFQLLNRDKTNTVNLYQVRAVLYNE